MSNGNQGITEEIQQAKRASDARTQSYGQKYSSYRFPSEQLVDQGEPLKYRDVQEPSGHWTGYSLHAATSAAGDTSYYQMQNVTAETLREDQEKSVGAYFRRALDEGGEDYYKRTLGGTKFGTPVKEGLLAGLPNVGESLSRFTKLDVGDLSREEILKSWGSEEYIKTGKFPKKESKGITDKIMKWFGKD